MKEFVALSGVVMSLVGLWNMFKHDRGTIWHATGMAEAAAGLIITHICIG